VSVPLSIALGCIAALFLVSVLAVVTGRLRVAGPLVYMACFVIALVAFASAFAALVIGIAPSSVALPLGLPWIGAHFRVDPLAVFFLSVVDFGAAAASLYGLGYGRHEDEPQRILPFFPAFLAAMNLVVLADDAFTFLWSWELMSLASWALVLAHHREEGNRRAATIYLLMASFGTLALLLAFGLMAGPDGGYAFADIRAGSPSPLLAGLVIGLALLGAGSKAGLVPLHVWLPLAHPAAPSHVSALMSAVMTKVAVYGFVRITFDLLGSPAFWWGVPVLALGGGTAVAGVLYAVMQTDLKRALAYSTIENIGLVFVGLGLALAFDANGLRAAGALALTAALFHVVNHMLFKSLLFFGAGAVLVATGERMMEHLGGLIRRMPVTSTAFLVGSAAISALPPLNGFASEWLLLQAILLSPQLPQWGLKLLLAGVGALLALSAALAAACFARIFGVVFLGRPRTSAAETAREVDRASLAAMSLIAALCLAAGILPGFVIDGLAPVVVSLTGAHMPTQAGIAWLSIVPVSESRSSYNGLLVFLFIASSAMLAALLVRGLASGATRRAPSWDCGFPDPSPATQYTASSFAQPIRRVFGSYVFGAREHVEMRAPGDIGPARFRVEMHDAAFELLYDPLVAGVAFVARKLDKLQFLTIRLYLSLVFFAVLFLLLVLALWP
jgi:hydrogenase-4 component B